MSHSKLAGRLTGYAVIFGSSVAKVPQILNIFRAESALGLSLPMYCMEVFCQIVTTLYHLHRKNGFDIYGENITLMTGNLIILFAWARISGQLPLYFALLAGSYAAAKALLRYGYLLDQLYGATIGVYIVSRLPQMYTNWVTKSTGVLSPVTFAFSAIGSLIRLSTSAAIQDNLMMIGMLSSIVCNLTLIAQIWTYRK